MLRMRNRIIAVGLAVAVAAVGTQFSSSVRAQDRSYILATATTGGTYYPVGVAIATLVKVKLEPTQKIAMSAISSAGSGENVKLMRENQAQFAILQGLFGAWAWAGTGDLKNVGKQEYLRTIATLWYNVEQFVVRASLVKTGTIQDMDNLKGRKFSIGARNSGTEGSGRTILGNLGYDVDKDFGLVFQGYNPTADSFNNGSIDAANLVGGIPVTAITQIFASAAKNAAILGFTAEQIKKANGAFEGLWVPYEIPANTYPGQDKPIHTMGQANFLGVRADVDENAVYLITKTMFENLPFLNNIHKATTEMSLKRATDGLPMPLHPGAARYYKEKGLPVPARLMAK